MLIRKLAVLPAAVGLVLGMLAASPASAAAAGELTCNHGPIAAGTYESIQVVGFCALRKGDVTVIHDVTIGSGAVLLGVFAHSNLTVGGNVNVAPRGALLLGCGPNDFPCFNDPTSTESTQDQIGRNLVADSALFVQVHYSTIAGNILQAGGGGGINCNPLPFGPPAYSTYEDNVIKGNVNISGQRTCWIGFFRNQAANVNWHDNQTSDPDGNEIASNTISGNLNCSANDPAPQLGDSVTIGNGPNTVGRKSTGQCPPVLQSS
jgi:hypothetical protein